MTQQSKHTPAPRGWELNGNQIIAHHTDEDGEHETLICDLFDQHDWRRGNARLIRSAPTMLAALRFALPYMTDVASSSDNKGEHRAAKLMRKAINEAEGGEP